MTNENLKKKNQSKRRNAKLTTEEWLTFFILPFFTTKPQGRDDHYSDSELERFKKYGFENKYKEAHKVKLYGFLFWFSLIIIIIALIA